MNNLFLETAKGNIENNSIIHKFGRNTDVGATEEDVWTVGGVYTWLQAPVNLEAISTSANDTIAGTGARIITVEGLDENWNAISEDIEMNGVSATLPTINGFIRINRVFVKEVGTYAGTIVGGNAGNIVLRTESGGATHAEILLEATVPQGQSQVSRFSVPKGHTAFVWAVYLWVDSGKSATLSFLEKR